MKINLPLLAALLLAALATFSASAQTAIPPERLTDWSYAGSSITGLSGAGVTHLDFLETFPQAASTDDLSPALQSLIDQAKGPTVIEFPAGSFQFKGSLHFDRSAHNHPIVIRGAGMSETLFRYIPETDGPDRALFEVKGLTHPTSETPVTAGFERGSTRLTVQDASAFRPGDTVVLRQENDLSKIITYRTDSGMPDRLVESLNTWAARATGQTVEVTAVQGNTLVLARPLIMTFDWGGLTALRVSPRSQVGFEGFTADNLVDGERIYLFIFNEVANSWIRDVRSAHTVKFHLIASQCRNLTVSESFFDDAYRHGGGGHGYGVALEWATSDCLVVNNLFRRLRHSMMFAKGIGGNVYAYNYSFDNFQDGAPVAKDISGHGHYPFFNLIEGNVAQFIHGTDYWGSMGPGNTFFRNRATDAGIRIDVYSPGQNVVGNEITASPAGRVNARWDVGQTRLDNGIVLHNSVSDALVLANTIAGEDNTTARSAKLPTSLYLSQKPGFWLADIAWPPLGPPHAPGDNEIPAMRRWQQIEPLYRRDERIPYLTETFDHDQLLWWHEGSEYPKIKDGALNAIAQTDANIMEAHYSASWCKIPLPAQWELSVNATLASRDDYTQTHYGILFGLQNTPERNLFETRATRGNLPLSTYQNFPGYALLLYPNSPDGSPAKLELRSLDDSLTPIAIPLPQLHPETKPTSLTLRYRNQKLTVSLDGEKLLEHPLELPADTRFALRTQSATVLWDQLEISTF